MNITTIDHKNKEENYYDIAAISASGINLFFKSPLHYWTESPFNPNRIISKDTDAKLLGRVTHKLVFEPTTFATEFVIEPKLDKRTVEGKKQFSIFTQECINKKVITDEIYQEALLLKEALFRNHAVRKLIGNGCPEKPIYWHHNGMPCKAKIDYYRDGLIIDYKTSTAASLAAFTRSLTMYGYHRQAAWYMAGIEHLIGERPRGFVFIVQDKSLPDAIGIYALDENSLTIANSENNFAAKEIKERLQTNQWDAFPKCIQEISIPAWYTSKATYGEFNV